MTAMFSTLTAPDRVPDLEEIFAPVSRRLRSVDRSLKFWPGLNSPYLRRMAAGAIPRKGKLIRPGIFLLITGHLGFRKKADVILAAAVEAMHLASLIHDDIIDRSAYRRGEKTALLKFGPDFSLLLGDFFFIRSIASSMPLGASEIPEMMAEAAQSMIEGEMEELAHSYNFNLSRSRYLKIIEKKTASLFLITCRLACRLGQAGRQETAALETYGQNLGLTFQVIDDILDLVAHPAETGKPAFSDLKEGRITLPIINALKQANPAGRKELRDQLELIRQEGGARRFRRLRRLLEECGALELAFRQAAIMASRARAAAGALRPSIYRQSLIRLVDFVLWRKK